MVYDGNNLKSLINVAKDVRGNVIGGDTTIYQSYTNFKNPYQPSKYIPDLFITSISENMTNMLDYNYTYQPINGNYSTGGTKYGGSIYTDNGRGYPKEVGLYKCD